MPEHTTASRAVMQVALVALQVGHLCGTIVARMVRSDMSNDEAGEIGYQRYVRARTRVLVSLAVGLVAGAALMFVAPWQVAVLAGWSASAATFVAWFLVRLWPLDGGNTAVHATVEDDSRPVADVLLISAALASLAAIGLALVEASTAHGAGKAAIVAVAVVSVVGAWAVVQIVFTLRYAHVYFLEGGGVDFNSDATPDYRDFAYLALTVGMTFQVSDTNIRSQSIRRTVMRHALISYVLGAVVVAMAINVVAGLLSH